MQWTAFWLHGLLAHLFVGLSQWDLGAAATALAAVDLERGNEIARLTRMVQIKVGCIQLMPGAKHILFAPGVCPKASRICSLSTAIAAGFMRLDSVMSEIHASF
jgi:hypothetical protein